MPLKTTCSIFASYCGLPVCSSRLSAVFHNLHHLSHLCIQFYFSIITLTLLPPHLSPSPSPPHHTTSSFSQLTHSLSLSPPFFPPHSSVIASLPTISQCTTPSIIPPSLSIYPVLDCSLPSTLQTFLSFSLVLAASCNIMWAECQVLPKDQTDYV